MDQEGVQLSSKTFSMLILNLFFFSCNLIMISRQKWRLRSQFETSLSQFWIVLYLIRNYFVFENVRASKLVISKSGDQVNLFNLWFNIVYETLKNKCAIFLLQNYWASRRSIQEIETSSQQGNFQHDQVSIKAGVVITSSRKSRRRFVRVFLTCLSVSMHTLLFTPLKSAHVDRFQIFIFWWLYDIVYHAKYR